MQSSATLPPDEAAKTLETVRAARDAATSRMDPYWFPLVVFGALMFISSFLFGVRDGAGVVAFWLVATPIGMFVVARHQRGEARTVGASRRGWKYMVALITFAAASIVFGAISAATGDTDLVAHGPAFVIPALLAYIAVRDRSLGAAAWGLATTAVFLAGVFLLDHNGLAKSLALCLGALSMFEGYTQRNRPPE